MVAIQTICEFRQFVRHVLSFNDSLIDALFGLQGTILLWEQFCYGIIRAVVVLLDFNDSLFMLCSSSLHALQQLKAILSRCCLMLLGICREYAIKSMILSKGIRRFLVTNRTSSGYFLIPGQIFFNIRGTIVHPFSNYIPSATVL